MGLRIKQIFTQEETQAGVRIWRKDRSGTLCVRHAEMLCATLAVGL